MGQLLRVEGLKKYFQTSGGTLHAVDNVSFELDEGKTLGVVGESGCGKSTLGRTVLGLLPATDGTIYFAGEDITNAKGAHRKQLQQDRGIAFMFITHDMSVVKHISHDIMVMYMGRAVEKCDAKELFRNPVHPYTAALLSAIPVPSIHQEKKRIIIQGEITTPIDPKPGCRFAARCPYATQKCHAEEPAMTEISPGHFVSCHVKAGA